MRQGSWLKMFVVILTACACSSDPVVPEDDTSKVSLDPIVITRPRVRQHKAPKKIVKREPKRRFSQSELKPELSRDEKLAVLRAELSELAAKGDIEGMAAKFASKRDIIGNIDTLLSKPETDNARRVAEYYLCMNFIDLCGFPEIVLIQTVLSPVYIRTNLGGEFPALIRETYEGEADGENIRALELLRLDGIEATLEKTSMAYQRLNKKQFSGYVRSFLDARVKRVKAHRPIGAFKLYSTAAKFKAYELAFEWLSKTIKCEGSEIIINMNIKRQSLALEELRVGFRLFTQGKSKIEEELDQFVELVKADDFDNGLSEEELAKASIVTESDSTDTEEPKISSKDDESKSVATNKHTEFDPKVSPRQGDIERAFKLGIVHYRKARKKKIEQKQLRKAQKYFDAAFEAWNILSERKPEAASKMEKRVSEVGVLQYDIIKRLKL